MIRAATPDDLAACIAMGREFHAEAQLREIPFDEESAAITFGQLLDAGGIFVATDADGEYVGMVGGLQYPHYVNGSAKVAQELFWWVRPEQRGSMTGIRLKDALTRWAKDGGCAALVMVCLPIDSPAEGLYLRMGYRPMEHSYIKGL